MIFTDINAVCKQKGEKMTNKEYIKEFKRWINKGRPDIWYRDTIANEKYFKRMDTRVRNPTWSVGVDYIVDDEDAEERLRVAEGRSNEELEESLIPGTSEYWKALKLDRQEYKQRLQKDNTKILNDFGIEFTSHNLGYQYKIKNTKISFYPTTGRFYDEETKYKAQGIKRLMKYLKNKGIYKQKGEENGDC